MDTLAPLDSWILVFLEAALAADLIAAVPHLDPWNEQRTYYILYQEIATTNSQFLNKKSQMDVLGRVLILCRKSGLSQVS